MKDVGDIDRIALKLVKTRIVVDGKRLIIACRQFSYVGERLLAKQIQLMFKLSNKIARRAWIHEDLSKVSDDTLVLVSCAFEYRSYLSRIAVAKES